MVPYIRRFQLLQLLHRKVLKIHVDADCVIRFSLLPEIHDKRIHILPRILFQMEHQRVSIDAVGGIFDFLRASFFKDFEGHHIQRQISLFI